MYGISNLLSLIFNALDLNITIICKDVVSFYIYLIINRHICITQSIIYILIKLLEQINY